MLQVLLHGVWLTGKN